MAVLSQAHLQLIDRFETITTKETKTFIGNLELVGGGPASGFKLDVYKHKMETNQEFSGTALQLRALNLKKHVYDQMVPSLYEAKEHATQVYMKYFADGNTARLPLRSVVVVSSDLETPGTYGTLFKITLDLQTWAVIWTLVEVYDAKVSKDPKYSEAARAKALDAVLHYPVDFIFIKMCSDFDRIVTKYAFQQMENIRKDEEQYAPSGWEVACIFDHVRTLNERHDNDPSESRVEEFFADMDFSKQAEYKVRKGNKTAENNH